MRTYAEINARYESLIQTPNRVHEGRCNGIYERYVNPVLTRAHIPPFWIYDPDPQTNPFMMQRRPQVLLRRGPV